METEPISLSELEQLHPMDAALLQSFDCTASFGDYQLLRPLGEGGMADVWHALWLRPSGGSLPVALKRILPERSREASVVRMFLDEARLAMRLCHPNIVRALDAGSIAGRPFIALELRGGVDLRQPFKAARSPLPIGFSLFVARERCRALDYAHRLGVVHRDVSPSNVMRCRPAKKLDSWHCPQRRPRALPAHLRARSCNSGPSLSLGSPPVLHPSCRPGDFPAPHVAFGSKSKKPRFLVLVNTC